MATLKDYTGLEPAWCPGCGNFGILKALQQALVDLGLEPYQVLVVSGIGQSGKLPHYMKCNTFNSLHGRPIPPAIGAKITNPELTVIAVSGDGDGYGEGGNHLMHAMRRNHDITYLVHNNQVYGLTKGQASPTSDKDYVTKTTPHGAPMPVNPMALAVAGGASFVARGFAGETEQLSEIIKAGITHKGFALIDILQPCVSFNRRNTFSWYKQRVYKIDESKHNPKDRMQAFTLAQEWGDRIPTGILYREERPTFEELLPVLETGGLIRQKIEPEMVEPLLETFV
jgi:2-oxoglutarate ferredoxin oxidoreductase subunit beta